jgi:hypothetical protein
VCQGEGAPDGQERPDGSTNPYSHEELPAPESGAVAMLGRSSARIPIIVRLAIPPPSGAAYYMDPSMRRRGGQDAGLQAPHPGRMGALRILRAGRNTCTRVRYPGGNADRSNQS